MGRLAKDRAVWSGLVTGSQLGHRGETGRGQGCVEWRSYWVTAGSHGETGRGQGCVEWLSYWSQLGHMERLTEDRAVWMSFVAALKTDRHKDSK